MSIHRSWRLVLALTSITLPLKALAQVDTPQAGSRVRVVDVATAKPRLTGTLMRMAEDTVVILSDGAATPTALIVGAARRLEISAGTHRRSRVGKGIGVGLVVGVATGALIGLASYQEPACPQGSWVCFDFGPGLNAAAGAFVGSLGGIVVGGIIGASSTSETWQRQ